MTIRERRKELNMRLVDLAKSTGIDAGVLSMIENKRRIPNSREKIIIATALGSKVEELQFPKAILAFGG